MLPWNKLRQIYHATCTILHKTMIHVSCKVEETSTDETSMKKKRLTRLRDSSSPSLLARTIAPNKRLFVDFSVCLVGKSASEYPSCHNYSCLRRPSWPINASNFQQLPCPGSETEICSWRSRRVSVAVRRSLDGPPGNRSVIGKIENRQNGERVDKKARTKRLPLDSHGGKTVLR